MQAVLVMFRSDGERRSFSVTRDMTVIGRREDCDLRIPLGEISRKHCRLVRDGDSLRLEDLGSSNGTYLNGQRVQEAILTAGDSIQVGPVVFVLQVDGQPAEDELTPITVESAQQEVAVSNGDMGPLSPTAQSEAGDMEMLEPLGEMGAEGHEEISGLAALEEEETVSGHGEGGHDELNLDELNLENHEHPHA